MSAARRRLDDAASTGLYVVGAAGALLAVASVVVTASPGGFVDVGTALAFAAFIALGELVRITLPGGRDAAPIATAGALAYTLLTRLPGEDPTHSALQVVAVTACACTSCWCAPCDRSDTEDPDVVAPPIPALAGVS